MLYQGAVYNGTSEILQTKNIYQSPIIVSGIITTLITPSKQSSLTNSSTQRFNFLVDSINNEVLTTPINIRLSWKINAVKLTPNDSLNLNVIHSSEKGLNQNQRWQLPVKLKPAHGFANPGSFNYQQWLRQHNLIATGYVKNNQSENIVLLENTTSVRQQWFNHINQVFKKTTLVNSQNTQYITNKATFLALTFGVRSELTQDDWALLQATGTQHIIAISGLHIGLVAGSSYFLCLFLIRSIPFRLMPSSFQLFLQRTNAYSLAIFCSLTCAFFYSYLAGFSSPTLRALTMLFIFWLAKLLTIKLTKSRLLIITLCLILLCQPMSLLGVGFWLSFYAVSIIFFIHWLYLFQFNRYRGTKKYILSLVFIQLGLSLFILPVAALLQNQLPSIAILTNLIAVPLMSFFVLPIIFISFLANMIVELPLLIEFSMQVLTWFWRLLSWLANSEQGLVTLSNQQLYLIFCMILLLLLMVLNVSKKYYVIIAMFFSLSVLIIDMNKNSLLAFSHTLTNINTNSINTKKPLMLTPWQLHVFDVGQGLSVLIEKNQRAILYDTGASYPSGFTLSEAVILPYLKSKGIEQLDIILISHSDNDHAGGLTELKNAIPVQYVIANDIALQPNTFCQKGKQFTWQDLQFDMLWPLDKTLGEHNDDSCVIRISDGKHHVLLTGDISNKVEKILVNNLVNNESIHADILVAPHHGSNTSSSLDFLIAVQPKFSVFSAGFMNRWSMPTQQIKERYKAQNISTLTTAESGMISFDFSSKITVNEYKKNEYPFWFAN